MSDTLKKIDEAIAKANDDITEMKSLIKILSERRAEEANRIAAEERQAAWEEAQERGRIWREEHPEEHAAFLADIRERNREGVIEGFLNGWWDLDENGEMAALPLTFKMGDFSEIKNPLMAHVMAKAGIFPSANQARKNGWDKPLTEGDWTVTKKKIRIRVTK